MNDFLLGHGWPTLIRDLGGDHVSVLGRAGLPADLLSRDGARLPAPLYFRFWRSLEAEVPDPAFAVRLAEVFTAEAFHPPVFAALASPDLRVALARLATYKRLVAPQRMIVDEQAGALRVELRWLDVRFNPPASLIGAELAFLVRLARVATRRRICPVRVASPVPLTPSEAYSDYFGAPVLIGEQAPVVSFSVEDARRPFLTASAEMWNAFAPELRRRLAELDRGATTTQRVRAVLLETLPSGLTSVAEVARRLLVSGRTLQRRLGREGTSFRAVKETTRAQLARHYLANTTHTLGEIAFLLGFEEPNSFFRAFQAQVGTTPQRYREEARPAGEPPPGTAN